MRIGIFSDLHGNPYAGRAVLQALRAEGVDAIYVAGDVCLGGSDPAACVDLLAEAQVQGVYGNTERYLLDPAYTPPDEHHLRHWHWLQHATAWVRDQLSPAQLAWLEALPLRLDIAAPAPFAAPFDGGHSLSIVHANPRDCELFLYPTPAEQQALWGEVRQPDDDPEMLAALAQINTRWLAHGHYHRPGVRQLPSLTLVNVACAGLPGADRDQRACYTLLNATPDGWQVTQRQAAYEVEHELQALNNTSMPGKERFAAYYLSPGATGAV